MQTKKTFQLKKEDVKREWHLIDAKGKLLGHLATEIAQLLIGKHKIEYTAHVDGGDYVVVTNAEAIEVTGKKDTQKKYYRHSQYPSGLKVTTFDKLIQDNPRRIIEEAVWGMLPKNKLRDLRMRRLKVVAGAEHPYSTHFTKKAE